MEAWSAELRPRGITVTTIHPGFVRTPPNQHDDHPMPFLLEVDHACRIMADGIERGRREVNFPWRMHLMMRVVRQLPRWFFEPALHRASLKKVAGPRS